MTEMVLDIVKIAGTTAAFVISLTQIPCGVESAANQEALMCGYVRSQEFGGSGGNPFADNLTEVSQLVRVNIRSGAGVDAIQAVWSTYSGTQVTGPVHGGGGGNPASFNLGPGEFIVRVDGRAGKSIDQLKFTTNLGNTHGPYGGGGGNPFSIPNLHIGGFFGRSGARVDAIGFFSPAPEATSWPLSDSTTKSL